MGVHYMAAAMSDQQHWLMSEPDAKAYARYCANALRHMPMQVAQKWVDFTAFGGAFFFYTGSRIITSMQIARGGGPQQQQQPQRGPVPPGGAQVFQFVPNPAMDSPAGDAVEPEIPLSPAPEPAA